MLVEVKDRLDDPSVREIVEVSVYPDPDKLDKTIEAYKSDDALEMYGYEAEGECIGIIGLRMNEDGEMKIEHLAVSPDYRGLGYGRGLILEVIDKKGPSVLIAETDEEAVDFYRNIGFEIESLGEKYPGTERFKCVYVVEPE
ncbi:GNAT family N-acetyltransferase [Cohnella cellulosilytica]|uniref:GNAT family N-acetyltransferase n=1 Tax=Cohnella cellulosilytica TaxID=986710 RepID=A0ABW2FMI0_9BACL